MCKKWFPRSLALDVLNIFCRNRYIPITFKLFLEILSLPVVSFFSKISYQISDHFDLYTLTVDNRKNEKSHDFLYENLAIFLLNHLFERLVICLFKHRIEVGRMIYWLKISLRSNISFIQSKVSVVVLRLREKYSVLKVNIQYKTLVSMG